MQGTVAYGGDITTWAFSPGSLQQPQAEYVRPITKTADKKRRKWQRNAAQRELSDTSITSKTTFLQKLE